MGKQDYEYRGLMASTWDLLRGDTSDWPDRFFFLDLIGQYGQPALDIGCGTGRLILDYMSQGLDVDGVDVSPEMLAICRDKAARLGLTPGLYQQGMEWLNLPRQYRTIIVPSSSFQLVTDPALARQAMRRFYDHLVPGGVLAMPFMILWQSGDAQQREWKLLSEITRPEDGAMVRRWARDSFDGVNQLEHTDNRYEVTREGQVIAEELHQREAATRWYTQAQARQLYRDAGFRNLQLFQGFSNQPASEADDVFVVVGQRS